MTKALDLGLLAVTRGIGWALAIFIRAGLGAAALGAAIGVLIAVRDGWF